MSVNSTEGGKSTLAEVSPPPWEAQRRGTPDDSGPRLTPGPGESWKHPLDSPPSALSCQLPAGSVRPRPDVTPLTPKPLILTPRLAELVTAGRKNIAEDEVVSVDTESGFMGAFVGIQLLYGFQYNC